MSWPNISRYVSFRTAVAFTSSAVSGFRADDIGEVFGEERTHILGLDLLPAFSYTGLYVFLLFTLVSSEPSNEVVQRLLEPALSVSLQVLHRSGSAAKYGTYMATWSMRGSAWDCNGVLSNRSVRYEMEHLVRAQSIRRRIGAYDAVRSYSDAFRHLQNPCIYVVANRRRG